MTWVSFGALGDIGVLCVLGALGDEDILSYVGDFFVS